MYITQISARAQTGKIYEALEVMAALAAAMKEKYPDANPHIFTHSFGPSNVVVWQDSAADLSALEARNDDLTSEPGFQGMMMQFSQLMIEGSIQTTLLRQRF